MLNWKLEIDSEEGQEAHVDVDELLRPQGLGT